MTEVAATTIYRTWMCVVCGFIYDEAKGLPEEGIAPGTRWEDVPDTWTCPDCGVTKDDFEMMEPSDRRPAPPGFQFRALGMSRAELQFRAVFQPQSRRFAGIEFQHVARRRIARIRRAAIAQRAGRHIALLRHQLARVVEIQDVQRNPGVLHPVGLRLLALVDEQHAVAGGHFVAEHQPASAFGIVVGDLPPITLAAQFHPCRLAGRAAAQRQAAKAAPQQCSQTHRVNSL